MPTKEEIAEWREEQRKIHRGHHGINAWHCPKCGRNTVCIDVDPGVTPVFLKCRKTEGCDGMAVSAGYPNSEPPERITKQLEWEWALPTPEQYKELDEEMKKHIDEGGLMLQKWSGRPSAYRSSNWIEKV